MDERRIQPGEWLSPYRWRLVEVTGKPHIFKDPVMGWVRYVPSRRRSPGATAINRAARLWCDALR